MMCAGPNGFFRTGSGQPIQPHTRQLASELRCYEKPYYDSVTSYYRTPAGCRPFHRAQAEYFQGTGACLNCSTHTSTPRSDEASGSHATDLDQTCHAIAKLA